MEETKEAMLARQVLNEATAADPAVASNMGRHMAALNLLLLGRRGHDAPKGEPIIQSGFRMTVGERDMIMAAATRLNNDVIHLAFDVEQATGTPRGIVVFRIEGEHIACYPRCALWVPAGSNRVVIVGLDAPAPCHFVVRPGQPLIKVEGWPAKSIDAGIRRGANALFKLTASEELRDAHVGATRGVVGFDGPGKWTYRGDRIAA